MSVLRKLAYGLVVLLLLLLGGLAWMFRSRAEVIPAELPPIDAAQDDPQRLVIPGSGGLPDLALADLRGKTVYFIIEDRESMAARESSTMSRAMARWIYPPDLSGYLLGDAEGFAVLAGKIEEFVGPMRPELRLPLYIDFTGVVTRTFKLPKGHTGVVVLGPTGEILYRHSGRLEGDELDKLRLTLGATIPAPTLAPTFAAGELDNAACRGRTCVLVFLGEPLTRSDIPGGDQGYQGDMQASMKQFARPHVRLASLVLDSDTKLDEGKISALLIGQLQGIELTRWKTRDASPEARAAFQIPEGEAAIVIINPQGELALRELGRVPMYKFGVISELIGVELSDPDER